MTLQIKMPRLGLFMKEGKVIESYKSIGEYVESGETICLVTNDHHVCEMISQYDGYVCEMVGLGELIPVQSVIIELDSKPVMKDLAEDYYIEITPQQFQLITPIAKKMAEKFNIDVSTLIGSGEGGEITKNDVRHAIDEIEVSNKANDLSM